MANGQEGWKGFQMINMKNSSKIFARHSEAWRSSFNDVPMLCFDVVSNTSSEKFVGFFSTTVQSSFCYLRMNCKIFFQAENSIFADLIIILFNCLSRFFLNIILFYIINRWRRTPNDYVFRKQLFTGTGFFSFEIQLF